MKSLNVWEFDRPQIIRLPNGDICFKGHLRTSPHGEVMRYSYYHHKQILFVECGPNCSTPGKVREVYLVERLGGFNFRLHPLRHVIRMEMQMVDSLGEK